MNRTIVTLLVVLSTAVGFVSGVAADQLRHDDDASEPGGALSDAQLRELSAVICGNEYVEGDGFEDDDGDGYGWLVSDLDQRVLSWDEAKQQAIADCRTNGPSHADDGDLDGIHDYLDPATCFPGVPDGGPPPSGAPYCLELNDRGTAD